MQAEFHITYVGGESFTVTAGLVDFVRAERHTGKPITDGNPSFETMCFVAFSAAGRAGKASVKPESFDAWLADVASLDDTAADAEGNEQPAE